MSKEDKVTCLICGEEYEFLIPHINSKHKVNKKEYMVLYPGAPLVSTFLKRKDTSIKKPGQGIDTLTVEEKIANNKKRAGEWMTAYNNKMWKDPEYRQKQSDRQKKVVAKQLENPAFVRMLSDNGKKSWKVRTKESRENHIKQASRQMTKFNMEAWGNPEYRKEMTTRASNLNKQGIFVYKPSCRRIKYKGNSFMIKSRWELAFMLFCNSKGWAFEYEPLTFEYEHKGVSKLYTPDFLVKEQNCFYEVKGRIRDLGRQEVKGASVKSQGYNYVLVTEDVMKSMGVWNFLNKARQLYKNNKKEIIL